MVTNPITIGTDSPFLEKDFESKDSKSYSDSKLLKLTIFNNIKKDD